MNEQITLEYRFEGNSPPDGVEALDIVCSVESRGALIIPDIRLAAMQTRLEEHGYEHLSTAHRGTNWSEIWAQST